MAARTRTIRQSTSTRERIKATQILNRLQANALGELKVPMTDGQIKCAIALLKKTLPDLSTVEVKGDPAKPVRVVNRIELVGFGGNDPDPSSR